MGLLVFKQSWVELDKSIVYKKVIQVIFAMKSIQLALNKCMLAQ